MGTYVSVADAVASVRGDRAIPRNVADSNLLSVVRLGPRGLGGESLDDVAVASIEGQSAAKTWPRLRAALLGIVIVAGVCLVIRYTILDKVLPTGSTGPVDGLTIFAVFFVAALGIERLLEPLSTALLPKEDKVAASESALNAAGKATLNYAAEARDYNDAQHIIASQQVAGADTTSLASELDLFSPLGAHAKQERSHAVAAVADNRLSDARNSLRRVRKPDGDAPKAALMKAAEEAERLSVRELERTVAFWTLATSIGVVVAASMKLYLLHTVGITAGAPWEEVLATGLIIGAGTKPLHDLVEWMSSKAAP